MKKTLIKTFTGVMAVTAVVGAMAITSNAAEVPEQMTNETTARVETVTEGQDNAIDVANLNDVDRFLMGQGQSRRIDFFREVINPLDTINQIAEQAAEAQPTTEETSVATEVEGQGDVIDDQFVVDEGWGDVIDDEFAYVEGQGDVIDDEFAVVEATDVAENTLDDSMPSDATILAVASVDGTTDIDDMPTFDTFKPVVTAPHIENKSGLTEGLEKFNRTIHPTVTYFGEYYHERINQLPCGREDREYLTEMADLAAETVEGIVMGEMYPGVGAFRKLSKAAECFSRAADAETAGERVNNLLDASLNCVEGAIGFVPFGAQMLSGAKAAVKTTSYLFNKICSWF